MTVAKLLIGRDRIVTVTPDTPVREAVSLLAEHRIGAVPVVSGEMDALTVLGIFSERDVIYGIAKDGDALLDRPVESAMTAPAITVPPETSLLNALSLMTRRRIRHLPVVETGRLRGFVSIGDLVKARIDHIQSEAEALKDYIRSA